MLRTLLIIALQCFAGSCVPAAEAADAELAQVLSAGPAETALVIFGTDTIRAEVARTAEERSRGLMHRSELAPDVGMLFVFPEPSVRTFWMLNTPLALDIAFMDEDLRILNIEAMEPASSTSHASRGPALYALETNRGWFAAHGIEPGDRARVEFSR